MSNEPEVSLDGMSQMPGPAQTIEQLSHQVAALTGMVNYLVSFANAIYPKAGQKVAWQVKQTDSGITLEGTGATVTAQGVLLGANFLPTGPTSGMVMFVIRPEGQQSVTVIESKHVKFLDE